MPTPRVILRLPQVPVINMSPKTMLFPAIFSEVLLNENQPSAARLLREVRAGEVSFVFAVMSKPGIETIPEMFYEVGVLCSIKANRASKSVLLMGECRIKAANGFRKKDENLNSYWVTVARLIQDENKDKEKYLDTSHKQIRVSLIKIKYLLTTLYKEAIDSWANRRDIIAELIRNLENLDPGNRDAVDKLIWWTIFALPETLQEDKQPFLESTSVLARIPMLINLLNSTLEILAGYKRVGWSVQIGEIGRAKKPEGRDKIKAPEDEDDKMFLAEDVSVDIKNLWKRFKQVKKFMNKDAQTCARGDLDRLLSCCNYSYEWSMFKSRLIFLLGLPWNEETGQRTDINTVARALDEDHYGLKLIKERICDGIAPKILNPKGKGQILCFVGPPGVGKTSLAKSIARALNRKLVKMSVGGLKDEAQIKGHRVTYIGSQAGQIIKLIRRCGVKNPVFVIDEIDKIGQHSISGDPGAAMLEVLDPEQNSTFTDHYLDCSFDLSKVMFICTANVSDEIQPTLRDRMDIIPLSSYLETEKMEIAKRYLLPKWMREVGLTQNSVNVVFSDEIIRKLIHDYTSEAGVRGLENLIASILRKVTTKYLMSRDKGDPIKQFTIDETVVSDFLGPVKFSKDKARITEVGEAIGLAWTPIGGSILFVQSEANLHPQGKKIFTRTGMQGKVMEESDEVAMTVIERMLKDQNLELPEEWKRGTVHLHIPEGAIPKDGPSAGVAASAALYSLAIKKPIKPFMAMTGEIDLKQNVLPVGGIKEKIVAAEGAGVREIILPKTNERNLYDVPDLVKGKLKFHFVTSVSEVIKIAFSESEPA